MTKDAPQDELARRRAGVNEAIEELGEIKEFLRGPAKFQAVGPQVPERRGAPTALRGTGKTLLARAGLEPVRRASPFYSISGSGSVRDVRRCRRQPRPRPVRAGQGERPERSCSSTGVSTPSGSRRGTGMGGGHDRARTDPGARLLVEMDGFDVRGGVILIAATDRPDVLDPALLRPGRFDRQIGVEAPDLARQHADPQGALARPTPSRRASTSRRSAGVRPASAAPTWPTSWTRTSSLSK